MQEPIPEVEKRFCVIRELTNGTHLRSGERLKEIAQFFQRKRPEDANTAWWNY